MKFAYGFATATALLLSYLVSDMLQEGMLGGYLGHVAVVCMFIMGFGIGGANAVIRK